MLTCKTVSRKVSAAMDEPITLADRLRVRMHLLMCPACRRFEQQMEILRVAIRSLWKEAPVEQQPGSDAALSAEASSRIKQVLDQGAPPEPLD